MRGIFVAIEGVDATGKTTLAKRLCEELGAEYVKAWDLRPAEEKRRYDDPSVSAEERFRYYLDRATDASRLALGIVESWKTAVADRFVGSTIACHLALGLPPEALRAVPEFPILPDVSILLTASVPTIVRRLAAREHVTRFEADADLLARIREHFARLDGYDLVIDTDAHDSEETFLIAANALRKLR